MAEQFNEDGTENGTCEICGEYFPPDELVGDDDWYGPPTCEKCREWARAEAEDRTLKDNWLNQNR